MPNIPINPIPSGLPTKHNYLRKAATTPTDFNPLDIILNTTSHSIGAPLGQKYLYTYDIDTKTDDDYTQFFLVDDNNNASVTDYLYEANELMRKGDDIFEKVYSNDANNITTYKYYNFNYLGRQKVIYFLDDGNQIIFSKILDDGNIEITADSNEKELVTEVSYLNYSNIKADTSINIYWNLSIESVNGPVPGAMWAILAPDEILYNTHKVVLYDTTKHIKSYIDSLEGVPR